MGNLSDETPQIQPCDVHPEVPVYSATVVSRLLGIPSWTLKQLDEEGIVSPRRAEKGESRLYSQKDLDFLQHCWFYLKEKGVKLQGLKVILEMEGTLGTGRRPRRQNKGKKNPR